MDIDKTLMGFQKNSYKKRGFFEKYVFISRIFEEELKKKEGKEKDGVKYEDLERFERRIGKRLGDFKRNLMSVSKEL